MMRRININLDPPLSKGSWIDLAFVGFYIVLTVLAYFLGWLDILRFTALLSLWALVETRYASYKASRAKDMVEHQQ